MILFMSEMTPFRNSGRSLTQVSTCMGISSWVLALAKMSANRSRNPVKIPGRTHLVADENVGADFPEPLSHAVVIAAQEGNAHALRGGQHHIHVVDAAHGHQVVAGPLLLHLLVVVGQFVMGSMVGVHPETVKVVPITEVHRIDGGQGDLVGFGQFHGHGAVADHHRVEPIHNLLQVVDVVKMGVVDEQIVHPLNILHMEVLQVHALAHGKMLIVIEIRVGQQDFSVGEYEFKALAVDPAELQSLSGA